MVSVLPAKSTKRPGRYPAVRDPPAVWPHRSLLRFDLDAVHPPCRAVHHQQVRALLGARKSDWAYTLRRHNSAATANSPAIPSVDVVRGLPRASVCEGRTAVRIGRKCWPGWPRSTRTAPSPEAGRCGLGSSAPGFGTGRLSIPNSCPGSSTWCSWHEIPGRGPGGAIPPFRGRCSCCYPPCTRRIPPKGTDWAGRPPGCTARPGARNLAVTPPRRPIGTRPNWRRLAPEWCSDRR